jgi:signal transduction histidine kinase
MSIALHFPARAGEGLGAGALTNAGDSTDSGDVMAMRVLRSPRLPLQAAALALGYYLGASVGFAFTMPGVPQSVMWLPNSLLLAALLLTPTRDWPVYLAAVLPAHLLVAWQNGAPLLTLTLLYVTNAVDAIVGASAVRFAMGGSWRLDTLRALVIFVVFGAALGPLLISFLDAGLTVLTGWGNSFWLAYETRTRANILTNIIVVPTIVGAVVALGVPSHRRPSLRWMEGGTLLVLLAIVAAFVFSRPVGTAPSWLYLPLPLLLWAALRFGVGGAGLALLVVAFASSWNAVNGSGAFSAGEPKTNVESLQTFLICAALPLLGFALVVREREDAFRRLALSRDESRLGAAHVRNLAGRLITAQEEERARIARELHDSVGQHIADLAITMTSIRRAPAVRHAGLEAEFQRLYEQTVGLFSNVRTISHELHPSVLRHAGLVAALQSFCDGTRERLGISVHFDARAVEPLPDDVALCAYRIAQEAVTNSALHSRAQEAMLTLERSNGNLFVRVKDFGGGFDLDAARRKGGLGLLSMEERARLMQGSFELTSGPEGTTITARLPVPSMT